MILVARQAFLAALFVAPMTAVAGAEDLPRLTGELTYKDYPKFAFYISQAVDQKLAFDLTVPIDNEESDGHLTTFVLDGQFELAYLNGDATSRLYADTGFELVNDSFYTLKGVYRIVAPEKGVLALETLDEEPAGPFKDMTVDSLPTRN